MTISSAVEKYMRVPIARNAFEEFGNSIEMDITKHTSPPFTYRNTHTQDAWIVWKWATCYCINVIGNYNDPTSEGLRAALIEKLKSGI